VHKLLEHRIPASQVKSKSVWDVDLFLDAVTKLKACGGKGWWIHVQNEVLRQPVSKFTGDGVFVPVENSYKLPGADLDV
jgi:hypothetical protein